MPGRARTRPFLEPAPCERVHRQSVNDLRRSLGIDVFDSELACQFLSDEQWSELEADFLLPAKTADGVGTRALIGEMVDYHREQVRHRSAVMLQHASQRDRRRQLGVIAQHRKVPQAMPAPLIPEVESQLAFRLLVNRQLIGDLTVLLPKISAEIREARVVTTELRRAAWEVLALGAFQRVQVLVGLRNEDRPTRLLISHAANVWRFSLGRPITNWRADGRARMADANLGYSRFARFVCALTEFAGAAVPIDDLFDRIERVLKVMFAGESCGFGCGFTVLRAEAGDCRKRLWRRQTPPEVLKAGGIALPGFRFIRSSQPA